MLRLRDMCYAGDAEITKWALAAGRGDRDAAEAFIQATHDDVWRFLVYLAGSAEAEDLTQETYLRALTSVYRFTGRGSARSWLLSIARRVAADSYRTAGSRPKTVGGEDWQERAESAMPPNLPGIDDKVLLDLAIRALAPERREAFVLTQVLGFEYAEVAEVCGCPIGTVRSRVARARQDLVVALGQQGHVRAVSPQGPYTGAVIKGRIVRRATAGAK
jgi:RNA polymerase sigma-70 factor (ECF subfamily)